MNQELSKMGMSQDAELVKGASGIGGNIAFSTHYTIECFDSLGALKWVEDFDNLVVTEGLTDNLDKYFKGATYTAAHYVGLTDGTPTPGASDTLASHAGWAEISAYTGNRQTLTLGTVTAGSVDNSASKAVFSITGTATVGGAFVCTVNTGTAGVLYGIGAFTGGDKSVGSGDTLNVTITLTATAA